MQYVEKNDVVLGSSRANPLHQGESGQPKLEVTHTGADKDSLRQVTIEANLPEMHADPACAISDTAAANFISEDEIPEELRSLLPMIMEGAMEAMQRTAIAQMAIESFRELEKVSVTNPIVDELREYAGVVEERARLLGDPEGMDPEEAEVLLANIDPVILQDSFAALIDRLHSETRYLDELEDVGLVDGLKKGIKNGKYGAKVLFVKPDSFIWKRFGRENSLAFYFGPLDICVFKGDPPSTKEIWKELLVSGRLPEEISRLDHELVHDKQYSAKRRLMFWGPIVARWGGLYSSNKRSWPYSSGSIFTCKFSSRKNVS